jgi:hypothetical protein
MGKPRLGGGHVIAVTAAMTLSFALTRGLLRLAGGLRTKKWVDIPA